MNKKSKIHQVNQNGNEEKRKSKLKNKHDIPCSLDEIQKRDTFSTGASTVNKLVSSRKEHQIKKSDKQTKLKTKLPSAAVHENKVRKNSVVQDELTKVHLKKKLKRLKWKQAQKTQKLERLARKKRKSGVDTRKENNSELCDKQNKDKDRCSKTVTDIKNSEVQKKTKQKSELKETLPKSAGEASNNWKKLQEVLSGPAEKDGSKTHKAHKRKLPQNRVRNPKYRKIEEQIKSEEEKDCGPEIWFDDVDPILLEHPMKVDVVQAPKAIPKEEHVTTDSKDETTTPSERNPLVKMDAYKGLTRALGMDCEMVGVGDGTDSVLARVSIVNQFGEPVYDKFVKPKEKVVDYRTQISGVRPEDLKNAELFETVQKEVSDILKNRILVGHAIQNDLQVLFLSHPKRKIRDTSQYKKFRQITGGRTPSLKKLTEQVLAVPIQQAEHNSVQDAQAAMRLYTMYKQQWEKDLKEMRMKKGRKPKTS